MIRSSADPGISDPILTLTVLFIGPGEHLRENAANTNDSGVIGLADPFVSLQAMFLGRAAIPYPGEQTCGFDRTADEIGCEVHDACE